MADVDFAEFMAETKKNVKTISMPNGPDIELPPIELAPDDFFSAARSEDYVEMAKGLVGEESYKRWVEAGANALSLLTVYAKVYNVKLPNSVTP